MSEEIKKQLETVSMQLQNISTSRATCEKLIEAGAIAILEANAKEGEKPAQLSISSPDVIGKMLVPILRELGGKKEGLLNAKESLLNALEKESLANETDNEEKDEEEVVKKESKK